MQLSPAQCSTMTKYAVHVPSPRTRSYSQLVAYAAHVHAISVNNDSNSHRPNHANDHRAYYPIHKNKCHLLNFNAHTLITIQLHKRKKKIVTCRFHGRQLSRHHKFRTFIDTGIFIAQHPSLFTRMNSHTSIFTQYKTVQC